MILANSSLASEVSDAEITQLKNAGIAVVTFGENSKPLIDSFGDIEDTYAHWFKNEGLQAAFIRPDFYIYGVAKDSAGVKELVTSFVRKAELV